MKIVIFGGSFNPPHKSHRRIVELLCQEFDEVIIVPCGIRPDKPSANIIPIYHRMKMIKIAFSNIKKVVIDFYDFENNVYTPAYLLQERYERVYPRDEIWHAIGEDIIAGGYVGLSEIHRVWEYGKEIWNKLNYVIVVRPGYNAHSKDMPPHSEVLEIGDIVGSGTLVRKRISDNRPILDLVEPDIDKYIKDNDLYRSNKMKTKRKVDKSDNEVETLIEIFKEFKDKIIKYKYPEELFGDNLEGDSPDEKTGSLKDKFRKLMIDYGADRYSHYNSQDLFDVLSEIQAKILELESTAEQAILDGTYGTRSNLNNFPIIGKHVYQVSSPDTQADFSETFYGTYKVNEDKDNEIQHVCIKMARITDDDGELLDIDEIELNNDSIVNEVVTLKYLDSIRDTTFQKVRKQHFPILLDAFKVPDVVGRQAFVTEHVPAFDFIALRDKFKNGVPLYHVCWILARMLSAAGHLHYNQIIHGNIHPEGLFVNPQVHNVTMADLEFSIIKYDMNQEKYRGTTEYYTAPEVYKGARPHPRTDIYSIGMSTIYILGGDVKKGTLPETFEMIDIVNPDEDEREYGIERIKNLILSFVNKHPLARSDDAWKAYHQLVELRKLAFGEAKFIEFVVPR